MFLRAVVCVLTIDTDTKASRFFELKAPRRLRRFRRTCPTEVIQAGINAEKISVNLREAL